MRAFLTYGIEALNTLVSKTKGDSEVEPSNMAVRTTRVDMDRSTRGWRQRLRGKASLKEDNKSWAAMVFGPQALTRQAICEIEELASVPGGQWMPYGLFNGNQSPMILIS